MRIKIERNTKKKKGEFSKKIGVKKDEYNEN